MESPTALRAFGAALGLMLLLLQPTGSVRVVLRPLWPLSKGVKAGSSTKMRKKELGEGQVRSHLSYMEVSGLSRVLEVKISIPTCPVRCLLPPFPPLSSAVLSSHVCRSSSSIFLFGCPDSEEDFKGSHFTHDTNGASER